MARCWNVNTAIMRKPLDMPEEFSKDALSSASVNLSPHLESETEANSIVFKKEDEVIGFFIAKLAFYDCVLYTLLCKMLSFSTLDTKYFFAAKSTEEIYGFFKKHAKVFSLNGKYVSLQCQRSLHRYHVFDGSKYPIEDMREVAFFFLGCLRVKCPNHIDELSWMLGESDIKTDFKCAFLKSSTEMKYGFLRDYKNIFYLADFYVSLHSLYENDDSGKDVIQHLVNELKFSPNKNFWPLINSVEVISEKFQNYFANFSALEKFYFFQRNSLVFNIDSDGYVSCLVDCIVFSEIEARVIDVLVKRLKSSQTMHYNKLCLGAENNNEFITGFFKPYLPSQKCRFFMNRPKYFYVNSDGFVSICTLSDACKHRRKNSVPQSNIKDLRVSKTNPELKAVAWGNPNAFYEDRENEVVSMLINVLKNENTIHINKLCNSSNETITKYFRHYHTSLRRRFFKKRKREFRISHQDYVSLSKTLIISKDHSISPCVGQSLESNMNSKSSAAKSIQHDFTGEVEERVIHRQKKQTVCEPSDSLCVRKISKLNTNKNLNSMRETTECGFTVTGDQIVEEQKKLEVGNLSGFVNHLKRRRKNSATQTEVLGSNNIVLSNLQISGTTQTCKSAINCWQQKPINSICQYKEFLGDFFVDHQQEIIGIFLDQLRIHKRLDFMQLLQSCEELNSSVNIVFRFFSVDEKLNFFMSCPQYFFVDNNFVSVTSGMLISPKTAHFEELIDDLGKTAHVASNKEKGQNAAKETLENFECVQQRNSSELLVSSHREIIITFLALLKVFERLHFLKLCKSSEKLNVICKQFFHPLSNADRLEFVKSYPQYFVVENDNSVMLSSTVRSFLPYTELPQRNICSDNRDILNRQSRGISNPDDVDAVDCYLTPLPSEKSLTCSLPVNSTKETFILVPASAIVSQDSYVKELSFFRTTLSGGKILHFEELFTKLEDSDQFTNYKTSIRISSKLKFFEDHSNIFKIHSKGFISLVPEADVKSSQRNGSSVKSICEETVLISDSEVRRLWYQKFHLSSDHIRCVRYFIKALQEREHIPCFVLFIYTFLKHPDVRSFLFLFDSFQDHLDFFKLHSFFIISPEEEISLRNSSIIADEALSTEDECIDVKASIISKAVEYFTPVLQSAESLPLEELQQKVLDAPGYIISFTNTNFPGRLYDFSA